MHKIILGIILCLLGLTAKSQSVIQGKVIDALSRQPLEAASVTQANGSETVTDEYGHFFIKSGNGIVTVTISCIGYESVTLQASSATGIVAELPRRILNLADFTLNGNRAFKLSSVAKIDLNLHPVKNTQELFRIVPGLFIAQHAGGGKAEQIFLRGFDSDHGTDVRVSVDGMHVNMVSHAHGQGYADAHFIIPETIQNVDFGTGPYYTQEGNLNTAGYINFSTHKSIEGNRIQLEAGRFQYLRSLLMIDLLRKNKDQQSAYIAAEQSFTNGPTINRQNFRRFNLLGKYNLAISKRTELTTSFSTFASKWDASGQIPQRAVENNSISRFGSIDPTEGGNTERHNASLKIVHRFGNGGIWENSAFFSRYIFSLFSNFTFYLNDPLNGDGIHQAEKRNILGYSSSLTNNYSFGNASLRSIYGVGIRHDATDDSKLAHVVKRQFLDYVKLGDIRESNTFAFIQQQLSRDNWMIDAGLRFDYLHFRYIDKLVINSFPPQGKGILTPKLNLKYNISKEVQLYSKFGKGFHSNDTRVVVAQSGQEILPAAYGADIGVFLKPSSKLFINAALWWLHLNQEFVYVGDEGVVEPSGKTLRKGIDLLLRYQFSKYLFASVNFNLARARALNEPKSANYIPLAPTATSVGGIFYKRKEGINGGLTYRYIKSRPANEDKSIIAKGYFLLDGSINYTRSRYEIGAAVENIFNNDWNEAQFATESRLMNEPNSTSELHFTPGMPFFLKLKLAFFF